MRLSSVVVCALVSLIGACLDPMVSDEVDRGDLVLPAGTEVPLWADDANRRQTMELAVDLPEILEPRQGFVNGQRVDWWDLGPASPTPIPGYILVEEREDGFFFGPDGRVFAPLLEHPVIFDHIPGDLGYSPLWKIIMVPVTDAYEGELITSVEALYQAEERGLVGASIETTMISNCPVVMPETRFRRTPGAEPEAPFPAYYKGHVVHLFVFNLVLTEEEIAPVQQQLTLRRDGGEPLSEPVRGVDMTGDGDISDTNDVFIAGPMEPGFSDLVRVVDVVIASDVQAIDTYMDEARSDITADEDLYWDSNLGRQWRAPSVLAAYEQPAVFNHPFIVRTPPPSE